MRGLQSEQSAMTTQFLIYSSVDFPIIR